MPALTYPDPDGKAPFLIHGHARAGNPSRTYTSWANMMQRCTREENPGYPRYGGRGIKVCLGMSPFTGFLSVMGECPPKLEIHRVNNDGHYSCGRCAECIANGWPMNCVWETNLVQVRHASRNVVLTVRGITACRSELCERFGVSYKRVSARLRLGWSLEDAFFKPKFSKGPRV